MISFVAPAHEHALSPAWPGCRGPSVPEKGRLLPTMTYSFLCRQALTESDAASGTTVP